MTREVTEFVDPAPTDSTITVRDILHNDPELARRNYTSGDFYNRQKDLSADTRVSLTKNSLRRRRW